jgi:DNA polymerase-3 subunit delta'
MWSNIIGQHRVKNILKKIYLSGRISHAYIFYGNNGTGKDAAAIEFAKLLNCDNPVNGNEACDKCKSCGEINSLRSSVFKYIIALPTAKSESDDDSNPLDKLEKEDFENYREELDAKAADKYHTISLPGANDIRISSIRQIKKDIYMTGKTGKKKIFIISYCDRMNMQSANSLLKILEEPPGDSILILTTPEINSLLPTITGRCQKIKFNDLTADEILTYIKSKNINISNEDSEFYSKLSGGSISKCNQILNKSLLDLRNKVPDLLSSIIANQYLKLGNDIDFIVGKKDKDRVKQFLILLAVWFRDIINKKHGSDELIINKDEAQLRRIVNFSLKFESETYKIINSIEEAILDIDSNIFPDLLLYNLSYKIKFLIRKKA